MAELIGEQVIVGLRGGKDQDANGDLSRDETEFTMDGWVSQATCLDADPVMRAVKLLFEGEEGPGMWIPLERLRYLERCDG